MTEKVYIRQNHHFQTEYRATDPQDEGSEDYRSVLALHELTPYGMLLASLGGCTAIVVNTYASNHGVPLDEIELNLVYRRRFKEDCENCEHIDRYEEHIYQEVALHGDLTEDQRHKLFQIAQMCSIHKMLEDGLEIDSTLADKMEG